MKSSLLVVALVMLSSSPLRAAEYVDVHTSWKINPSHQTYKNNDTKIDLGPRIAAFRLKEAQPGRSDGSAKFIYYGDDGFITLYQEPSALVGVASPGAYVDAQSSAMEEGNGKFDAKSFFAIRYRAGGKTASGRSVVYHFIHSPEIQGKEVWDEFGVVQIGQFFLSYRGSFLTKRGLDDLAIFLRAIGIRKA